MLKYMRMGNKRIKAVWWVLIAITVVTFVFIFGTPTGSRRVRSSGGDVASVEGTTISRGAFQSALSDQRALYRRQYGTDPSEEDGRMLEAQAWRAIVTQTVLGKQARRLGLKAYDAEVVTQLKTSPPPQLTSAPDFQTNGKFDPAKYQQALSNTGNNWAPFEQMVRDQMPARKLQERLAASLKLSQPELQELYQNMSETAAITVAMVAPQTAGNAPAVTDADIDKMYEKYKGRFASAERVQLEILQVPKTYSPEELRLARETAEGIALRAKGGEDFATLAKDYSQGPGASQGGAINRVFQPGEFGPQLAGQMATLQKGDIAGPIEQAGSYVIFKIADRVQDPASPTPSLRVAQIVIKARIADESLRQQFDKLQKVRDRATRVGLSKAATEAALATVKAPYVELGQTPPQLYDAPEAVDWANSAKIGAVSPVVMGNDAIVVVQMADRKPAGPASKDELKDQLRQLAEMQRRVDAVRPQVDRITQAVAQGQKLEQAASANGAQVFTVPAFSRMQPDPRVSASPEVVGAAFGAPAGKVAGPFESATGWFFVRRDGLTPADTSKFDAQRRGQLTTQLLNQRQQAFFTGWLADVRGKAKIEDLRNTR